MKSTAQSVHCVISESCFLWPLLLRAGLGRDGARDGGRVRCWRPGVALVVTVGFATSAISVAGFGTCAHGEPMTARRYMILSRWSLFMSSLSSRIKLWLFSGSRRVVSNCIGGRISSGLGFSDGNQWKISCFEPIRAPQQTVIKASSVNQSRIRNNVEIGSADVLGV